MSTLKFYKRAAFILSGIGAIYGGSLVLRDYSSGVKFDENSNGFGKTFIVTGANCGIGKETAHELAKRGGRVLLACRDMKKCEAVRQQIVDSTFNKNVECRKLDLSSIRSIREFCENVKQTEKHVDVLINNAGIMRCPRMLTEDGFEIQLGVNHMGHFLLTNLLLDKLSASDDGRIVVLASRAHSRGQINFEDLNSTQSYDPGRAYEQSKLANVIFTRELSKRLEGTRVTVNCVDPGLVQTEITRHMSFHNSLARSLLSPLINLLVKTPLEGAQTVLYCALSDQLRGVSGRLFRECAEAPMAPQAQDDAAAKRLWLISEKWTRLRSD